MKYQYTATLLSVMNVSLMRQVAVLTNGAAETIIKPLVVAAGLEDIVTPLLDINMAQVSPLVIRSECKYCCCFITVQPCLLPAPD
jgi:hypothetical protein